MGPPAVRLASLLLVVIPRAASAQIRIAGLQSGGARPASAPLQESSSSGLEDFGNMWGWRGGGHAYDPVEPAAGLRPLPASDGALRDAPAPVASAAQGRGSGVRLSDGRLVPWARDPVPAVPLPRPRPVLPPAAPRVPANAAWPARSVVSDLTGLVAGSPERDDSPGRRPATLIDLLRRPTSLPSALGAMSAEDVHGLGRGDYLLHLGGAGAPSPESGSSGPAGGASAALPPGIPARLFVVAELRLPAGADLSRALPELSAATGFKPAESDPVLAAALSKGRAAVRGWIDAASLERLVRHPWVSQAGLEYPVGFDEAPSGAGRASTYVTLRLLPDKSPEEGLRDALARMSESAGFEWKRTVGFRVLQAEDGPGRGPETSTAREAGTAVIIFGELPPGRLVRLLKLPFVLRLDPASLFEKPAPPRAGLLEPLRRSLWLLLGGSLLLAFPWISVLLRLLLALF